MSNHAIKKVVYGTCDLPNKYSYNGRSFKTMALCQISITVQISVQPFVTSITCVLHTNLSWSVSHACTGPHPRLAQHTYESAMLSPLSSLQQLNVLHVVLNTHWLGPRRHTHIFFTLCLLWTASCCKMLWLISALTAWCCHCSFSFLMNSC